VSDQLHLIIATLQLSPFTYRDPDDQIILFMNPGQLCGQECPVALGIAASAMKFKPKQTAADIIFVIPQSKSALEKWDSSLQDQCFRCICGTLMTHRMLRSLQQLAA
jgi:hypothetical protein